MQCLISWVHLEILEENGSHAVVILNRHLHIVLSIWLVISNISRKHVGIQYECYTPLTVSIDSRHPLESRNSHSYVTFDVVFSYRTMMRLYVVWLTGITFKIIFGQYFNIRQYFTYTFTTSRPILHCYIWIQVKTTPEPKRHQPKRPPPLWPFPKWPLP